MPDHPTPALPGTQQAARLRLGSLTRLCPRLRRLVALSLGLAVAGAAQDARTVPLPKPRTEGGRPLMEVLKERQSIREFSERPLPDSALSDLLWAAFGVNRPASGQRTAPSTMNCQAIDVFVARADGVFRFDPGAHQLKEVSREDVRLLTGGQDYVRVAPVALIFVSDYRRLAQAQAPEPEREFYSAADTGFISQNVYLFCASEGLGCVVHVVGDKARLSQALKLHPDQRIILAQAVGYRRNDSSPSRASTPDGSGAQVPSSTVR